MSDIRPPFAPPLRACWLLLVLGLTAPGAWAGRAAPALPLAFESNRGQASGAARFVARGPGFAVALDERSLSVVLPGAAPGETARVTMRLAGSSSGTRLAGERPLPGRSNYLIGSDPRLWLRDVPHHGAVRYSGVYPGIDLLVRGDGGRLEYDFLVAPGADPGRIRLALSGVRGLRRNGRGEVELEVPGGTLVQEAPVAYQEVGGVRRAVKVRYRVWPGSRLGFAVGPYDRSHPLVIDPVLSYSSYLGGNANDRGFGVALDPAGNVYVTGDTASTNFPTIGALQATSGGATDAFLSKLDPSGSTLLYSTYLGGAGNDRGYGIALDAAGNVYVVGETNSADFPLQNALQGTVGGAADAFVSVLDPSGTALVYSTFLGGSGNDRGRAIAVTGAGIAYAAGETSSNNFPTRNPIQATRAGGSEAFLAVLPASGTSLAFATFLGGSGDERALGVALDDSDNPYLTGETDSDNFPTRNPLQPVRGGERDAFVAKIDLVAPALAYSTYLGGGEDERGNGIRTDRAGNAFVVGETSSDDFPTVAPYQAARAGNHDVFVTQIDPTGTAMVVSTYLGGRANDRGYALAVDGRGSVYLTGETSSTNFPTASAAQPSLGGGADAFLARLELSGQPPALMHSTYLGGGQNDRGRAIALGACEQVVLTGETGSTDFPVANPYQAALRGGNDGFVAWGPCPEPADLGIAKALAPGQGPTAAPGETVSFVVRVVNSGTAPFVAGTLDDRLEACFEPLGSAGSPCDPSLVSCAGAGCAGTQCSYTLAGFTLTGFSLDPGASIVVTVNARAGAQNGPCANVAETSDGDADLEIASAGVTIRAAPAIVVRKTALPGSTAPLTDATFLLEVDNTAGTADASCTFDDPVSATGCMTLKTCDLTSPPITVLCSPPAGLSSPGFVVAAGVNQQIRFTVTAGAGETDCLNTARVTCDGLEYTAQGTLVITGTANVCPLLYADVAFPPAFPTRNWPRTPPWVYTAPCSAGGDPLLASVLASRAVSGDLNEVPDGAEGTLRLYQVDCAIACPKLLLAYKNWSTGRVALDLR